MAISDSARVYLLQYNLLQAVGWLFALNKIGVEWFKNKSIETLYSASGETVSLFQFIAALEILHAAIGIVGGSPVSSLMQWFGRSNVLFAIVRSVPEVQNTVAVGAMLIAWSLSEIIRYPWYATSLAGFCPRWLTWLRYTAFIPLYPIGVWGEMYACYLALPYLEERKLHSISLPNPWNISFDYALFIKILLFLYPFLWWQLFSMLLRQRKKKLGNSSGAAATATATGEKKRN